jgi:methylenetetrahydrofolate reductase (NADPH)
MNSAQLIRFSDACGAEIPRWLRLRLNAFEDDAASIKAFGLDVVTDLCQRLLAGGAPGLHFYTMNQSAPTLEICSRLGLLPSGSVAGTDHAPDELALA